MPRSERILRLLDPGKRQFMRVHIRDILSSITWNGTDATGRGIYASLLFHSFLTPEGILEGTEEDIKMLCGCTDEQWDRAWPRLRRKFIHRNGGFANRRVRKEIALNLRKSASAARSAGTRWGCDRIANGMRTACERDATRAGARAGSGSSSSVSSSLSSKEEEKSTSTAQGKAAGAAKTTARKKRDPRVIEAAGRFIGEFPNRDRFACSDATIRKKFYALVEEGIHTIDALFWLLGEWKRSDEWQRGFQCAPDKFLTKSNQKYRQPPPAHRGNNGGTRQSDWTDPQALAEFGQDIVWEDSR